MSNRVDYGTVATLLATGTGALMLTPTLPFLLPMGLFGVIGGAYKYYYDSTHDPNSEMWKQVGLITKDEKVPLLVNSIETNEGNQYVYHLPDGLCFSDVEKAQEKIENSLKKAVKIDRADNYNVIITTFTKKLSNLYKFNSEYLQKKLMLLAAGYSQNINGECLETIQVNSF